MKSPLKDHGGSVLIFELALLALVLGVAGLAGYNYYQHKNNSNPAITASPHKVMPTPSPTLDLYVGWNSYSLKNEKLTFKFPSDWTLSDSTSKDNNQYDAQGRLMYAPGTDVVKLKSKTGLQIEVTAGGGLVGGSPDIKNISSTPVRMLGGTYYLNFPSDSGVSYKTSVGGWVHRSSAGSNTDDYPLTRNIKLGPGATDNPAIKDYAQPSIVILLYFGQTDSTHYPVSKFQQDSEYSSAIKIFESMTY